MGRRKPQPAEQCRHCNGSGHRYWALNVIDRRWVEVSKPKFDILSETEDDAFLEGKLLCKICIENCVHCEGLGYIKKRERRFRIW